MSYIVVFITTSNYEEAEKIADALVDSRLASCVNVVSGIESIFIWQGKKEKAKECLLIAKTKQDKFSELSQKVKDLHSYDTPEIISWPISDGDSKYLDWIEETLQ